MTADPSASRWTPRWLADGAAMRGVRRGYWRILRRAAWVAGGTYLSFGVGYAAASTTELAAANFGAALLCALAALLLGRRRNTLAQVVGYGGVFLHSVVATLLVGWDSGFHLYLLCLVPLLVVVAPGSTGGRLAFAAGLLASYLGLRGVTSAGPLATPTSASLVTLVSYANAVFAFLVLTAASLVLARIAANTGRAWAALATTDPLTGLHNRRHLLELGTAAMPGGSGHHTLSVAMIDIDHFKRINDRWGHDAGDLVLCLVSERLCGALRDQDTVSRWGGEEFVALLPGADEADAWGVAERLRAAVAATPVRVGGELEAMTVTVGVARVIPGEELVAAITRADLAMYQGKAAGRNRVVVSAAEDPRPPFAVAR